MHNLIIWVRHLKRIAAFKLSTRTVVITLMLLGIWIGTKNLEFPPDLEFNDKLIHFVVFFGLALLVDLSSSCHPFWLCKGLPLLVYGTGIEVLQYFTPSRSFSLLDILADFSGILLYFIVKSIVVFLDTRRG